MATDDDDRRRREIEKLQEDVHRILGRSTSLIVGDGSPVVAADDPDPMPAALVEGLRGTVLERYTATDGALVIGGTQAEWVAGCLLAHLHVTLGRWPTVAELRQAGVL